MGANQMMHTYVTIQFKLQTKDKICSELDNYVMV